MYKIHPVNPAKSCKSCALNLLAYDKAHSRLTPESYL